MSCIYPTLSVPFKRLGQVYRAVMGLYIDKEQLRSLREDNFIQKLSQNSIRSLSALKNIHFTEKDNAVEV